MQVDDLNGHRAKAQVEVRMNKNESPFLLTPTTHIRYDMTRYVVPSLFRDLRFLSSFLSLVFLSSL